MRPMYDASEGDVMGAASGGSWSDATLLSQQDGVKKDDDRLFSLDSSVLSTLVQRQSEMLACTIDSGLPVAREVDLGR